MYKNVGEMLTQCTKMCFWKCTKMFFVNFQMCQNVIPMYKNVNPMFSKCTFLHIKIRGFKEECRRSNMYINVHKCTLLHINLHFHTYAQPELWGSIEQSNRKESIKVWMYTSAVITEATQLMNKQRSLCQPLCWVE